MREPGRAQCRFLVDSTILIDFLGIWTRSNHQEKRMRPFAKPRERERERREK
jgi:hypothetical protein